MSEIVWLTGDLVQDLHARQLKLFGGPPGLRDGVHSNRRSGDS